MQRFFTSCLTFVGAAFFTSCLTCVGAALITSYLTFVGTFSSLLVQLQTVSDAYIGCLPRKERALYAKYISYVYVITIHQLYVL